MPFALSLGNMPLQWKRGYGTGGEDPPPTEDHMFEGYGGDRDGIANNGSINMTFSDWRDSENGAAIAIYVHLRMDSSNQLSGLNFDGKNMSKMTNFISGNDYHEIWRATSFNFSGAATPQLTLSGNTATAHVGAVIWSSPTALYTKTTFHYNTFSTTDALVYIHNPGWWLISGWGRGNTSTPPATAGIKAGFPDPGGTLTIDIPPTLFPDGGGSNYHWLTAARYEFPPGLAEGQFARFNCDTGGENNGDTGSFASTRDG